MPNSRPTTANAGTRTFVPLGPHVRGGERPWAGGPPRASPPLRGARSVWAPRATLTKHASGLQPLDLGGRISRFPQHRVAVLPHRWRPAWRHLRLGIKMKWTRHREALAVGEGNERADALELLILRALIDRVHGAKGHARRIQNSAPVGEVPLGEYLVQNLNQGGGILAPRRIGGKARIVRQLRAANCRQEAAQLPLLVKERHDEPATVAAAIVIGERIGRLGARRPMRNHLTR